MCYQRVRNLVSTRMILNHFSFYFLGSRLWKSSASFNASHLVKPINNIQFNASKCKVMSITRKQRPEAIVNIALIAVCSLAVTKFAHWLMSRLRRRNKRYQNREKAKTNGNCSKLSAAWTIPITRAWCHTLWALRLVHCETTDLFSTTSLESQELILPNKNLSLSLEILSACTVLSHGSIMLPPRRPRVFARLARWQKSKMIL